MKTETIFITTEDYFKVVKMVFNRELNRKPENAKLSLLGLNPKLCKRPSKPPLLLLMENLSAQVTRSADFVILNFRKFVNDTYVFEAKEGYGKPEIFDKIIFFSQGIFESNTTSFRSLVAANARFNHVFKETHNWSSYRLLHVWAGKEIHAKIIIDKIIDTSKSNVIVETRNYLDYWYK